LQHRLAEALQLQLKRCRVVSKPGIVFLVRSLPVVILVVEEILDIPEAKQVGARLGALGPGGVATTRNRQNNSECGSKQRKKPTTAQSVGHPEPLVEISTREE